MVIFKATKYMVLCGVSLLSIACSSNTLSVSNEEWSCNKEKSIRYCLVTFKVTNSSHFPVDAKIRIRAHQWGDKHGSDQKTNNVFYANHINKIINAKSSTEFKETIKVKGDFTNIVISAYGDEV